MTKMIYWIFLILTCCRITFIGAVTPTNQEMNHTRQWISDRFSTGKQVVPPFSFVFDGTPSEKLFETWDYNSSSKKLDDRRIKRVLSYSDPNNGLVLRCIGIEYEDFPAIEWFLEFDNTGTQNSPVIEQIEPLDVELIANKQSPFILHYSLGEYNSAESYAPVDKVLPADSLFTLYPRGGRSSDGIMPFFNLEYENQGCVIAIGWSGQWEARFQGQQNGVLRVQAGMQRTHFVLFPGETVRTPRILLVFWKGGEPIRGNNLFRQLLIAHYLPRRDGQVVIAPICGSVNEVDTDGSYEGSHLRVMPEFAERGIEVFWSDMDPQHWYPIGFTDGTGTWEPDAIKYPHGLKPIGDAAHAAGLQYLLWFEPERVAPGTRIDKVQPQWVMKRAGEKHGLFKLQDPQARAWLIDYIDVQITDSQLDWLRYDFNIEPLEFWRLNDVPDRQGITEIRYIEGLYAMWDTLRARHPGMIIDMCASGGRRNDLEALMRGIPLWHSDMQVLGPNPSAEQLQNSGLFRWIPFHGTSVFDYEPSYQFRSGMTTGNIFSHPGPDIIRLRYIEKEAAFFKAIGITLNPWYFAGPFHQSGVDPFHYVFEPEKSVDLKFKFGNGILGWEAKPQWTTAAIWRFSEKDSSAYYVYRTIQAERDISCPAYLGSDDGIRVWLNNQMIFENDVDRSVAELRDFVELKLVKGENRLLLKIANHLKRTGFYFSMFQLDQRDRILDTAFPETETDVKRSVAIYQKIRPYMMGDFYPLFQHNASEKVWYGYQFHRPDMDAGMVVVFRRKDSPDHIKDITLCGINKNMKYKVSNQDSDAKTIVNGKTPFQVEIQQQPGSVILFYSKMN